ncbi:MAG TPA: RNA polymerase sigma factor [Ktedonobacterales bacterium]|jgi:RNA polymerase sigma-70 factor (ECF subfamily)
MGWLLKPYDAQFGGAAPPGGEQDERAALDAQLEAHKGVMICVAAALVGPADAEDAAQEASLRAWRSWEELRDAEVIRSWLLRITVNVCHDWLRGRFGTRIRRTESLDGSEVDIATLDLDPGRTRHAAALDLRGAINRLEKPLRVAVVLRYYADLDSAEIGAALGVPAATVRTRLRRALELLQDALATDPHLRAIRTQGSDRNE